MAHRLAHVRWMVLGLTLGVAGMPWSWAADEQTSDASTQANVSGSVDGQQSLQTDRQAVRDDMTRMRHTKDAMHGQMMDFQQQRRAEMAAGAKADAQTTTGHMRQLREYGREQQRDMMQDFRQDQRQLRQDRREVIEGRPWRDRDNNPPGPRGGAGTNWENPPGPRGGTGASPDRPHANPPGPMGGPGRGHHEGSGMREHGGAAMREHGGAAMQEHGGAGARTGARAGAGAQRGGGGGGRRR